MVSCSGITMPSTGIEAHHECGSKKGTLGAQLEHLGIIQEVPLTFSSHVVPVSACCNLAPTSLVGLDNVVNPQKKAKSDREG